MNYRISELRSRLQEGFASTWNLLSDTNYFLSRTSIFPQYEATLREWRHQLETYHHDTTLIAEIRKEIVTIRKDLRQQGYDLMLGHYRIKLADSYSENALSMGYKRCVLIRVDERVYTMSGQANHNELREMLSSHLNARGIRQNEAFHSLWYRWDNRLLHITGSYSESKDDYELLKEETNDFPFPYIKAFRKI